jgi:serine-type D-Ala-D-Ala carboxypeptidase (penicillin-binding protein 5/6)
MRRGSLVLIAALALARGAHAAPPTVDARAYTVVNASTGTVLASSNADEQLPIASITKLMTVIVALQHLRPDDEVTVTAQAAHVGQESIPLYAGEVISVHDLLEGALVQSANDAAWALAAGASNDDEPLFVQWMNEEAQKLGLTETHFVNPDGLDAPGHVSSAHDVAVLA